VPRDGDAHTSGLDGGVAEHLVGKAQSCQEVSSEREIDSGEGLELGEVTSEPGTTGDFGKKRDLDER